MKSILAACVSWNQLQFAHSEITSRSTPHQDQSSVTRIFSQSYRLPARFDYCAGSRELFCLCDLWEFNKACMMPILYRFSYGSIWNVPPTLTFPSGKTGTSVTVKNIFARTPVRLERMKKDRVKECKNILNMMYAYMLAHPRTSFSLSIKGTQQD